MKIIAHRGGWQQEKEKNTVCSFIKAIDGGFGIETDFRDYIGELVISHNPSTKDSLPANDFFSLCENSASDAVFALNVKADGLQTMFADLMGSMKGLECFLFDMSVPDALGYIDMGFPVFTRQSEWEPNPSFYQEADGIWIDSFKDERWIDRELIAEHFDSGKKVCIVSPELHARDSRFLWDKLLGFPEDMGDRIMLCTDLPNKARSFFSEKN